MTNEEIENLVIENQNLIWYVLERWFCTQKDDEDLYQEGLIALWDAAKTFDPSKAQFSTYAVNSIKNKFYNLHRKENAQRRKNKDLVYLSIDDADNRVENEVLNNVNFDDETFIKQIWEQLDEKDRELLKLKIEVDTLNNMAEILGCSRESVRCKLNKSKAKFLELYNRE